MLATGRSHQDTSFFHYHKRIENDGRLYGVDIYDLSGAKRHTILTSNMCVGSAGVIYVFEKTRPESLESLETWVSHLDRLRTHSLSVLVGHRSLNQAIMNEGTIVSYEEGRAFASKNGMMSYFETSLSEPEGARQPFDFLFTTIEECIPNPPHPAMLLNRAIHLGEAFDTHEMRSSLFSTAKTEQYTINT
ncbi:ras-related protein Rab-11A-like [Corticium candelabrum]|uniref:ras-related protein Rab-11A-like n=1 Tax=Corticium candelabrum TaxID=121492 RepID=UPI002E266AF0|nr:ras-related protein Rab-11A-like [Corticium candelabrum]